MQALWLIAIAAMLLPSASAGEPKVRGSLSSATATVGEPVDYELTIDGSFDAADVPVPAVDGLEVRGTSQGSQLSIVGGDVQRRTSYTYRLIPTREGTFTIPSMEVVVEGKRLSTKAVTLKVTAGQQMAEAGDRAFAEIRLSKKAPYVGEAVPIEVRLYLEEGPRWQLRQQPVLSGSGFTLQPFGKFSERPVEMAGKNYIAVTFRSIITPGKAGKVTIGPLPVKAVYSDQTIRFGMIARPGPAKELEVTAPAVEMDAQLLPSAGRPADFAGAIGNFTFEGVGTPNRVNIGEPVQMVLKISGSGNFDRVSAPALADADGWRLYDGENKFEPDEEGGISGTKTFTIPVAPTTRKTQMPVFSFAFFNPESGKYQTLKTASAPLTVTGAEPPATAPAAPSSAASPAAEAATSPAPAAAQDILGILPERGNLWAPGRAFSTPLLLGLVFAPMPIIAAALYWRRRSGDEQARQRHQWKRDRAIHLRTLHGVTDPAEFYDAAARVLQIDAALANGKAPQACELADILSARKLPTATEAAVEEVFNARAALVYAGGSRGNETIRSTDRDRVLDTLASYERSEPR
jgi:hypothetical protein